MGGMQVAGDAVVVGTLLRQTQCSANGPMNPRARIRAWLGFFEQRCSKDPGNRVRCAASGAMSMLLVIPLEHTTHTRPGS
jgi:hypothetical protein